MALSLTEMLIVALAAYRASRFLSRDTLIEGWRDRLTSWAFTEDGNMYAPVIVNGHLAPRVTLARGKLADLLTCTWCSGVWCSAILYVATVLSLHRHGPWFTHIVSVLAIAGVQGFVASKEGE